MADNQYFIFFKLKIYLDSRGLTWTLWTLWTEETPSVSLKTYFLMLIIC